MTGAGESYPEFEKNYEAWSHKLDKRVNEAINQAQQRPQIVITDAFMRHLTAASLDAIERSNRPNPYIFKRGAALVRLHGGRVELLTPAGLRGVLDRVADFLTKSRGEFKPVEPPLTVVKDILSLPEFDLPLPELQGISRVPVFLPGGRLLSTSGYDVESGIYLSLEGMKKLNSDIALNDAVSLLLDDLLSDFPYSDSASRAHSIAALLLPFVRYMIAGPTPNHLAEASCRGTGKGLLMDVISEIATGGPAPVMGYSRDEGEMEKRITSLLLEGQPLVLFDNISCIKSANLCAALTTTSWRGRVLGKSETRTIPNFTTWLTTGNNVELSDEVVRRTISIRLDANVDRPEERRGFKHPDLIGWVRENRAFLVSACLSVIKAWVDAGQPRGTTTLGRFESWAQVIGGILKIAEIEGFLQDRDRLHSQSDTTSTEWVALCSIWHEKHGERAVSSGDIYKLAHESEILLDIWGGRSALAAQQRMGHALSAKRDQVFRVIGVSGVSGVKICRAGQDGYTKNQTYRLSPIQDINSFHLQHKIKHPKTPETPHIDTFFSNLSAETQAPILEGD
ncbi:MAG: hypothetical protein IT393_10705 [Nitrospirae bacterium]|nr:hypothetical protein [Nitrospirota bacterium]